MQTDHPSQQPKPDSVRQKKLKRKPVKGGRTDPFKNPPDWIDQEQPGLGGRPTKMNDETLRKLMAAWSYDCTMEEAAGYAQIAESTLQNWVAKYGWLLELRERLKNDPIIRARRTWVGALEHDVREAREYLYAKRSDEFKKRSEITGKDGEPVNAGLADVLDSLRQRKRQEGEEDGSEDTAALKDY